MDAVANGNLQTALFVLQLADVDRGLAFAANVDEGDFSADRDDRALDGLPFSIRLAWSEASNIAAKSSVGSLTVRSLV